MDAESGILIVAYPENDENHDIAKELAFEYWVSASLKPQKTDN